MWIPSRLGRFPVFELLVPSSDRHYRSLSLRKWNFILCDDKDRQTTVLSLRLILLSFVSFFGTLTLSQPTYNSSRGSTGNPGALHYSKSKTCVR